MKFARSLLGAATLMLFASSVPAAIVTAFGDDVSFTYDDSTLYGTGIVVGNSIFFQPTSFKAESLNGAGVVAESEMLDIQVEITTAGFWMESFQLGETGDYFLSGAGASVSATGLLEVTSNTSAFSDSVAFDAGPLTVQGITTEWSSGASIDLSNTAGWNNDTDVTLMIDNDLTADTQSLGEQASIQKKLGGVGLSVAAVPVPAAVWLFGSALGLLGFSRRKSRKS